MILTRPASHCSVFLSFSAGKFLSFAHNLVLIFPALTSHISPC